MKCPYCNEEMKHGKLTGDGRSGVRFDQEGVKVSWSEKFVGVGYVKANNDSGENFWKWRFELEGDYCEKCRKIILDAVVEK